MYELKGLVLDQERALYGLCGATVLDCEFAGPQDGESALKECRELTVKNSIFQLRYPLWHLQDGLIAQCEMTESCRAALWYCNRTVIRGCKMHGIKVLRECDNTVIEGCDILSDEMGWNCRTLTLRDTVLEGKYAFFGAKDLHISDMEFTGKYSFQYVENAEIDFCTLHTKDAFWHAKNVTVTDSVLEGEYLGWYSENLTLIGCVISGTQPFINCKNLTLIDCKLDPSCDLCFEGSEVNATLRGTVTSVKNPLHGNITAEGFGAIIRDGEAKPEADCEITVTAP